VVFQSWLNHHKPIGLGGGFGNGTGKYLFRLLFPHEGSRRRYGLKETKLAVELENILGLSGLRKWDSVSWEMGDEGGTGCLGKEVEVALKARVR
jgi:DNA ligase-4